MKSKLTTWIFLAMLAGIVVGWMCHQLLPTPETAKTVAGYISLFTDVFLRLIKMIIAPLVFSTLVVGIAHMGDAKSIGRIGLKTMGWFITASLFSLLLGLVLVNILQPGASLNLPLPEVGTSSNLKTASLLLSAPRPAITDVCRSARTTRDRAKRSRIRAPTPVTGKASTATATTTRTATTTCRGRTAMRMSSRQR